MRTHTVKMAPDVLDILGRSTITGNILKLPPEQLEREVYERVDKALRAAGGKWNRKERGHLFPFDPRTLLETSVENGVVIDEKRTLNFFPTPPPVADRVAMLAGVQPGMRVLEPSAGTGNLLAAIHRARAAAGFLSGHEPPCDIVAVEIDPVMASAMPIWLSSETICADFLTLGADRLGTFDRVVMNPPFERGADIQHIMHALKLVKPGGRLVAISSNGTRQQERLKPLATSWAALPSGTFADTGVNAALMVIVKA